LTASVESQSVNIAPIEIPPAPEATAARPAPVTIRHRSGAVAYWAKVWVIAAKDLRTELRAKEVLGTMIAFGLLAVVVFGLAFDLRVPAGAMVAPGVLWGVILFAGVLGLHRSFGAEVDRSTLPALLLAPIDRSAIYFGKFLAQLLFLATAVIVIAPAVVVIFNTNILHGWVLVALFLGLIGYSAVGTLFGALTAGTRARESMLPILLLPVMAPVFMAGIGLTANILDGRAFVDFRHWLLLLLIYDIVFLTVAYLVCDLIWEDT
jgi:heme exporter protein B